MCAYFMILCQNATTVWQIYLKNIHIKLNVKLYIKVEIFNFYFLYIKVEIFRFYFLYIIIIYYLIYFKHMKNGLQVTSLPNVK